MKKHSRIIIFAIITISTITNICISPLLGQKIEKCNQILNDLYTIDQKITLDPKNIRQERYVLYTKIETNNRALQRIEAILRKTNPICDQEIAAIVEITTNVAFQRTLLNKLLHNKSLLPDHSILSISGYHLDSYDSEPED